MRLTRYTDYALRTLIYVGLHEPEQSSIAAIARAYGISENLSLVHISEPTRPERISYALLGL